jgi:hypothetical protein
MKAQEVAATKALISRPTLDSKMEVLLVLKVHPTPGAIGYRSCAGRHVSQPDRLRIQCLEAGNNCNALITVHSLSTGQLGGR